MGRLSALALFALVVVVTVVALQAPAAWFVHRLAAALGGAVQMQDTEGTVWNGRGVLASPDGRWKVPVGWHLRAAPLLRGEVELELEPQQGRDTPRGTVTSTPVPVAMIITGRSVFKWGWSTRCLNTTVEAFHANHPINHI